MTLALIIEPGQVPVQCDINASLEGLQALVGGWVEHVRVSDDVDMFVNEAGRLHGLPVNDGASLLAGRLIVGPAIVLGHKPDGDLADLPEHWRTRRGAGGSAAAVVSFGGDLDVGGNSRRPRTWPRKLRTICLLWNALPYVPTAPVAGRKGLGLHGVSIPATTERGRSL